jgi:hypothetical protein
MAQTAQTQEGQDEIWRRTALQRDVHAVANMSTGESARPAGWSSTRIVVLGADRKEAAQGCRQAVNATQYGPSACLLCA